MESFLNVDNFWDLPQHPATFSALPEDDFLALLQKQFPASNNIFDISPPDGVDPLNINPLGIPNPTPPSTDSSPSPPSNPQEPATSRPQSGVFSIDGVSPSTTNDDPSLKRKASDDSMSDDQTQRDAPSSDPANKRPASGPHRRKSTGHPHQDETRLLKRKEQNRAAQRAFRERKEKHVKDLEDKVAALEAKNQQAVSENDNLRDLLTRLQSENMALKQAQFTFNVPKPNNAPSPSTVFHSPQSHIFSSPGASTSTSASSPAAGHIIQPQFDVNFASLIPFDPASLNMMDEPTATDSAMNMDYGFGQSNGVSPYKTIASNPMFMSFAEPTPYDLSPPPLHPLLQAPSPADSTSSGMQSFSAWTTAHAAPSPGRTALESLFGGFQGSQPSVDFQALLESPPSAVSPVAHAGVRSNPSSPPSSNAAPETTHPLLTPGHDKCPKTKEEVSRMIERQGQSVFVESPPASTPPQSTPSYQPTSEPVGDSCTRLTADSLMASVDKTSSQSEETVVGPNGGFVKKMSDGTGSIVMCKGSSFPKTEKSERNIEVLTAWRTITSNPQFKNVDINDLCSEFTKKARCDGTKVVLEPESVSCIIQRLGKGQ